MALSNYWDDRTDHQNWLKRYNITLIGEIGGWQHHFLKKYLAMAWSNEITLDEAIMRANKETQEHYDVQHTRTDIQNMVSKLDDIAALKKIKILTAAILEDINNANI